MSVRTRTLLVAITSVVVLTTLAALVTGRLASGRFAALERQHAAEHLARAEQVVDNELVRLARSAEDWATWDDSYQFAADHNAAYREANLLLEALLTAVALGAPLVNHTGEDPTVRGILPARPAPLLVASRPILTSQGEGPPRGSIVMGAALSPRLVEGLGELTRLDLRVGPAGVAAGQQSMRVVGDSLAVSTDLVGLDGKPALTLAVDVPREITSQGAATVRLMLLALLAVGLVVAAVTVAAYHRVLLGRLARLSTAVRRVASDPVGAPRVPVEGADELTGLARDVNSMLEAVVEPLGLAAALGRANGGDTWYEPTAGGACFVVRLPLAGAPDLPLTPPVAVAGRSVCSV